MPRSDALLPPPALPPRPHHHRHHYNSQSAVTSYPIACLDIIAISFWNILTAMVASTSSSCCQRSCSLRRLLSGTSSSKLHDSKVETSVSVATVVCSSAQQKYCFPKKRKRLPYASTINPAAHSATDTSANTTTNHPASAAMSGVTTGSCPAPSCPSLFNFAGQGMKAQFRQPQGLRSPPTRQKSAATIMMLPVDMDVCFVSTCVHSQMCC